VAEELECGKRVELNPDAKAVSSKEGGNTIPAARAHATAAAENAAITTARDAARKYACKAACSIRRFEFFISDPVVGAPALNAFGRYEAEATCEWKCSLTCVEDPGKQDALGLQIQKFVCTDDFTRIFEGEVTGKEIDNKRPNGWFEEASLLFKLLKNLDGQKTVDLWEMLAAIRCPHRCKNKRLHVWIWPDASEPKQTGPDANGWFTWTTTAWMRVEAKCSD
jgi:hypothetical protein